MIAVASLLVFGSWVLASAMVWRAARMPRPLAGAAGLAVLICFESLLMNALSAFHAVTRTGVAMGHAGALIAGAVVLAATRRDRRVGGRILRPGWPGLPSLLVLALALLALASALRYAPNNSDSMTYHLARVAHWMQRATVAPYPTGSVRQTVMMPGAEYVLLALQLLSGTDRLAALLQLGAYLVVAFSAPAVARLAGVPSRLARWAAPLVAALPMAVLQASSTQNDLVATAMVIAMIATAVPVLRARSRSPRPSRRALLLALACTAAVLVKATAVLVALPFLAVVGARSFGAGRRLPLASWVRTWIPAVLVASALLAPELARRDASGPVSAVFVYSLQDAWGDRALNAIRVVFHHLPAPAWTPRPLVPHLARWGGSLVGDLPQLIPHEDVVGNPLQVAGVLVGFAVLLARWRAVPRRARWAMACLAAAWLLFHGTLRDNPNLSRLQLPFFALAPVFLGVIPRPSVDRRRGAVTGVAALAVAATLAGAVAAAANELRPPLSPRQRPLTGDYYRTHTLLEEPQATALRLARETGCRRLGIFMGESGYDYPLTWRAMQEGIEVRHAFGTAEWACLVYAEPSSFGLWRLPREPVALSPAEWTPAAANVAGVFLYRRREGGTASSRPAAPPSR